MNYERLTQWVAGPFAMVVGVAATKLVDHVSFLGSLGLQRNAVAHAIVAGTVFVASTGVTYAGHHKWLTNVAKWWTVAPIAVPAQAVNVTHDPAKSPTDNLRDQVKAAGMEPVA